MPDLNFDPAYNMEFKNLAKTNFGGAPVFTSEQIALARSQNTWWENPYEDLVQSAPVNVHNLSVTGGGENINYRVAAGIVDQESVASGGNFYDRLNFRINLDASPTEKIDIGTTISISRGDQKSTYGGFNSSNLQGPQAVGAQIQNIFGPIYNSEGNYAMVTPAFAGVGVGPGTGKNNNYGYVTGDYYDNQQIINNSLMNAYVAYSPIENLKIKGTAAIRNRSTNSSTFNKLVKNFFPDGSFFYAPNNIRQRTNRNEEFFTETYFVTADYNVEIGDGKLDALVGYSQEENKLTNIRAFRDGHLTDGVQVLNAGLAGNQQADGGETGFSVQSFFARVGYNYKGKYLLEANIRRDGS